MENNMKFNEEKFKGVVKRYLELARDGDWEHSLRVVKWVKELGQGRDDINLLVIAAYVHDIGWSGMAPQGKIDLEEMIKLEPKVAENSPILITKILTEFNFTDTEIEKVIRLVAAADEHESQQEDEEILVDADNLSKLCIEHLQQKYQPESFSKLMDRWDKELAGRIKTKKGKELLPKLLSELKLKLVQIENNS